MKDNTNDISINTITPHSGQARILKAAKRFNTVATGRRFGKTTLIFIIISLYIAYNLKNKRYANIAVIAPSFKNIHPIWMKFKRMFANFITQKSEQHNFATIRDKFNVEFWSIEQIELMRGRDYCLILMDECALVKGLKEIWNTIIFATLSDWEGSAWFFSTPKGFNDFYTFFDFAFRKYFSDTWASFHATFLDNPDNLQSEYDLAKQQLSSDFFAQEYDAEFISLGNNLFKREDFEIVDLNEIEGNVILQVRYWDIASSEKGDYTASVRLVVTDTPAYYITRPFKMRGKWGQVFPKMKNIMISESIEDVTQVIETDGIGNIAWQIVMTDSDLATVRRYPADRRFTKQSKYDRASAWALESQLKRVKIENNSLTADILEEFETFPYGKNDDIVDSVSGGFLSINYLFGGFKVLAENKNITPVVQRAGKKLASLPRINPPINDISRILREYADTM